MLEIWYFNKISCKFTAMQTMYLFIVLLDFVYAKCITKYFFPSKTLEIYFFVYIRDWYNLSTLIFCCLFVCMLYTYLIWTFETETDIFYLYHIRMSVRMYVYLVVVYEKSMCKNGMSDMFYTINMGTLVDVSCFVSFFLQFSWY